MATRSFWQAALLTVSKVLLLTAPATAQGRFQEGDLFVLSRSIQAGPGFSCGAGTVEGIVRLAAPTMTKSVFWVAPGTLSSVGLQYDSYRHRLVLSYQGVLGFVDAGGLFSAPAPYPCSLFAVAGNGVIYLKNLNGITVVDGNNVASPLLVATVPFALTGIPTSLATRYTSWRYESMVFDPFTNSIVIAGSVTDLLPVNGISSVVLFQRIPIDATGSVVVGPSQYAIGSGGGNVGRVNQMVVCPNQSVLAVAEGDVGPQLIGDSIIQLDPASMTTSFFAGIGQTAIFRGLACDHATGRGIVYDTWTDVIRSYALGALGTGTELAVMSTVVPASITIGCGGFNPGSAEAPFLTMIPPSPDAQTFGVGCPGTAGVPQLGVQGNSLAVIGRTASLVVSGMAPAGAGLGFLGFNDLTHAGLTLPVDLGVLGMTGCSLFVSIDSTDILTGNGGSCVWNIPVPYSWSLVGVVGYLQGFCVDPGINAVGGTMTNAVSMRVGH